MPVTEIKSKAEFDKLVNSKGFVAVQAHAEWCGPCKAISPIFAKKANSIENDDFAFVRFDTDDVPDLAQELSVRSIPAFFFFEKGEKVNNITGANPAALNKAIDELVAKTQFSTSEDF